MILNCLIKQSWIARTMALRLSGTPSQLESKTGCIRISAARWDSESGAYTSAQAQSIRGRWGCTASGDVWVRPPKGGSIVEAHKRIFDALQHTGVSSRRASIRVGKSKHWTEYGIIVDIKDATALLTALYPGILERKCAEIYNDDDH